VIAAASYGAKLARSCGGFFSQPTKTIATCQIQFFPQQLENLDLVFHEYVKPKLFELAEKCHPRLLARGGGVHSIELRALSKPGYYVIHVNVNTLEAMGANIVNTIAEEIGRHLPSLIPCTVGSKILTNLTLHRLTKVWCEVELSELERDGYSGEQAAEKICSVWEFANLDPFRAATHNKGVMNGIDPVVIATGNDWRAVEAGCHAYASLSGSYKPLTKWFINENKRLQGEIVVPIAVGTVGGVTKLHPSATACLKLIGNPTAAELSVIIASTGLAQNLSAIRALGCEGIQKGHMALHEKNLEMMRHYDHLPRISVVDREQGI
jgi:hydroxymethylglutaryl-CoA reductase